MAYCNATASCRGGDAPTLSNRSSILRLIGSDIGSNTSNQLLFTTTAKPSYRKRRFYVRSEAKPKLKDPVIVEQGSVLFSVIHFVNYCVWLRIML